MSTDRNQVVQDAEAWITSCNSNVPFESALIWVRSPEKNMKEALTYDWEPEGDWNDVWDEVLDRIADDFHYEKPEIIARTPEGEFPHTSLGEATKHQCRKFLTLIENEEAWIDGEPLGFPNMTITLR